MLPDPFRPQQAEQRAGGGGLSLVGHRRHSASQHGAAATGRQIEIGFEFCAPFDPIAKNEPSVSGRGSANIEFAY
jgi:hypothetical protein